MNSEPKIRCILQLTLTKYRWLNPAKASTITVADCSVISSSNSDLAVVDVRDAHRNSVGFVEPRAKEFSIADLGSEFPDWVEICAMNKNGDMLIMPRQKMVK